MENRKKQKEEDGNLAIKTEFLGAIELLRRRSLFNYHEYVSKYNVDEIHRNRPDGDKRFVHYRDGKPYPRRQRCRPRKKRKVEWLDDPTDMGYFGTGDGEGYIHKGKKFYWTILNNIKKRNYHKRKKGRQGRSFAVRERRRLEKEEQERALKYQPPVFERCVGMCGGGGAYIEDFVTGDVICTNCGAVQFEGSLGSSSHLQSSLSSSKPYSRVVHFRQRMAQVTCRDPEQNHDDVQKILDYIMLKKVKREEIHEKYWGKGTFSKVCKTLNLNPKLATHWMQIRKSLDIYPYMDENSIDGDILYRLNMRYFCVSHAFQNKLKKSFKNEYSILKRNNVVNLNYTIIQLIRLESEEEFKNMAKYFPQLISQQQPATNNRRWAILMEYCRQNYGFVSDPIRGSRFEFDWSYKPLLTQDLLKYFYYFH